uniref:Uncharacterized protein n=1 Tax=Populus trichocarpa TaxID=3694 RepID=A9P8R7_POPTR|nr:unknown [Populus trichocarpa]
MMITGWQWHSLLLLVEKSKSPSRTLVALEKLSQTTLRFLRGTQSIELHSNHSSMCTRERERLSITISNHG